MSIGLKIARLGAVTRNRNLPAYRQLSSKVEGSRYDLDVVAGSMSSPSNE